jgi:hypothetical protein
MKDNKDTQPIDRLCDFLVEEVLSATDEEIIQEAAEDYANPGKIVVSVQESIGRARLAVARKKLSETKGVNGCIEMPRLTSTTKLDDVQIIRIFEKFTSQNEELKLSIAARKGKDLTVQDMRSLIDDLHELGCDIDEFIKQDKNE